MFYVSSFVCSMSKEIFTVMFENAMQLLLYSKYIFFPCSTSIEAPKIVPMFPAYYIFNGLLILLLILHCFWTYLILKIAYNSLNAGLMEGDIRSSSDEDYEENSHS